MALTIDEIAQEEELQHLKDLNAQLLEACKDALSIIDNLPLDTLTRSTLEAAIEAVEAK